MTELRDRIKVIAFDVFGTVVDWHGSVKAEIESMNLGVDGGEFALAWRAGYKPAMAEVMDKGEWIILDVLHRRILDRVLSDFGLDDMDEPIMRTEDTTFTHGAIGFGSFDDTGNIDDVKLWAKVAE